MAALPIRSKASKTIAAAEDYADNDVLSESASNGVGTAFTFLNMAPREGGVGEIFHATIKCSAGAVVAGFRLHLFSESPTTSEMDDNAALNMTTADRAKHLGWIDFTAASDQGDYAMSQASGLSAGYYCADGARDLYGILQATDAETNETAGMTVEIELFARPY